MPAYLIDLNKRAIILADNLFKNHHNYRLADLSNMFCSLTMNKNIL